MPRRYVYLLLAGLLCAPLLLLSGCGCGFDCNDDDDDDDGPALLTLSLSDALPEDLSEVVIDIDAVTLRRSGGDVVIDTFTVDGATADSIPVNLLAYRGVSRLAIITDLELDTGVYSGIELTILDDDNEVSNSYVIERGSGEQLPLTAAADFTLPGFTLASGAQEYVIEFGLARSLSQPSGGNYRMSTEGVLVLNTATATRLTGQVDSTLFDTDPGCVDKEDPLAGNRVYIYEAQDLDEETLADVFTSGSSEQPPGDAAAPFAVATLAQSLTTGAWEYAFGYLPAGDYTLAFACNTAADDAIEYDALDVPLPVDQVYALTLEEGRAYTCNITPDADCE